MIGKRRQLPILLALVGATLLSACTQELDLTLYPNEEWRLTSSVTVTPISLPLTESISIPLDDTSITISPVDFAVDPSKAAEILLNQVVANAQRQGAGAQWQVKSRSKSKTVYSLLAEGYSWDQLTHIIPGTTITVTGGSTENTINFAAEAGDDLGVTFAIVDYVVRLHTGALIDSNSVEVRGNTATWRNPRFMRAEFRPASKFLSDLGQFTGGAAPIVLVITVVLLALGGGAYLLKRWVNRPTVDVSDTGDFPE